jgi:hypothetical protein
MIDLPTLAFLALRRRFFDDAGRPVPFKLRDKRNTQDDPFDEHLATDVLARLDGVSCAKATGPLITPDMVLYRPSLCEGADFRERTSDIHRIVGIEVKKLERTAQGNVARGSGLDYNTTPPCGRVRVYDVAGTPLDIRSFYLFVCLERAPDQPEAVVLTALCLVDGNSLNEDFELYLSITGEREKRIGLGSYGDGADRARPMLIFANPLGVREFDRLPILIHPSDAVPRTARDLQLTYLLRRSVSDSTVRSFYCYRWHSDVPDGWAVAELSDPFPTPEREARTRPRGRFRLPFRL